MASKAAMLALECKRLSENCLYTSTSFFIYLRFLRSLRIVFVVAPLALGALATWKVIEGNGSTAAKWFTGVCSLLAGLLPSIYSALKLDDRLAEAIHLSCEFKNLQDRFRQAAQVSSLKAFAAFEADVEPLMKRLEDARRPSLTPPEPFFKLAQKKVKSGDYTFDVDLAQLDAQERAGAPSIQQANEQPAHCPPGTI